MKPKQEKRVMKSTHCYRGIWMLVGLVAMLAAPMAIGYFVLNPTASHYLQAEASK